MNVYTEQAVSKITFVLAQIRHQTQLGSQILIALQYDHLITGLSQPTLMDPTYVPHREESFFVVLPTFYGKMVSNYTFPQ
jgi:phytoene dehydrogenase-like protein